MVFLNKMILALLCSALLCGSACIQGNPSVSAEAENIDDCRASYCLQDALYNEDVSDWQEKPQPPKESRADFAVWSYAANYSKIEWNVLKKTARFLRH